MLVEGTYTTVAEMPNYFEAKKCSLRMRPTTFPEAYQRLEYIEATGTQFINTRVIGKSGITTNMKMQWTEYSGDAGLLTARKSNTRFYGAYQNPSGTWSAGYNALLTTNKTFSTGVDYTLKTILEKGKQEFYVNDELVYQGTSTEEINTELPLLLFTLHINGTPTTTYNAKARVYWLTIYDNGKLIRDYKPCLRKSDGAVGLLDIVSGVFYGNAGSGTFIKGENF